MKARAIISLSLLTLSVSAGAGDGGKTAAPSLTFPGEARGAALGEAYSAEAMGSHALWYNPAGLPKMDVFTLSVMHTLYLEEMSYSTLAGAYPIGRGHAVGLGIGYFSAGNIPSYNASAQPASSYSPKDLNIRLAYAKNFSSFNIGLTLIRLHSTIQDSASSNALTAGIRQDVGPISLAVSMENLGSALKYHNEPAPLPRQWRFGSRCRILPMWIITSDMVRPALNPPWVAVGTEIQVKIAKDKYLSLRGGFNNRLQEDVSGLTGVSAGTGFQMGQTVFNYAWLPIGDLGQTHRFSIDFQLGGSDYSPEENDSLKSWLPSFHPRLFSRRAPEGLADLPLQPWKVTKRIFRSSQGRVMDLLARDALCPSNGPKAVLVKMKGKVIVKKADHKRWARATIGQYFFNGDTLQTIRASQAQLLLPNGVHLQMAERSELQIKAETPAVCELSKVHLGYGRISAQVEPESRLTVETSKGETRWSGAKGSVQVSTQEITMRVATGSAAFTTDERRFDLRQGKVYRMTNDQARLSVADDPDSQELEKPLTSTGTSTVGRWNPATVGKFRNELQRLDSTPDLMLAEYIRDSWEKTTLQKAIDELKQRKDELSLRSSEFQLDTGNFKDLVSTLRARVPNETPEQKNLRRQNLADAKRGLHQAKKSFSGIEKELKTVLKEFRFNEEYLAAIPIIRMLNITAHESTIPFEKSQETLSAEAYASLDKIAESIRELSPYRVVVEGHTDKSGTPRTNRRLSKRRAEAVVLYLRKKTGLPSKTFTVRGAGSDHPLVEGESPEFMARNRRVEIWMEFRGL